MNACARCLLLPVIVGALALAAPSAASAALTKGWRIVDAKVRKGGSQLTAVVEAWIPGGKHVQGLIRNGDQWQVGYEFGGEVKSPGDVAKTSASAACAAL